ncbi:TCP-1/cpn60 chaperonin family protein [Haladaptatus sp. CMAA 1911]|uniref:TCP-1/cpn60 chaperonin family protein n=1 Tax=unclassified Haladaptatus TaxID=2622732 RepID=UPI003753F5A7
MNVDGTEPGVEGVDRSDWTIRDEEAREYIRRTTQQVASLVRSTIGPYGLEKLVETHDLQGEPEAVLTGSAEEILAAVERGDGFNDPVAALFVDSVDSVQRSLGDGTGTAVLLADELIRGGLELIEQGLHPSTIVVGYAIAAQRSGEILDTLARKCTPDDRDTLARVASTAMTADLDDDARERYAELVAEAVASLATAADGSWFDTDDVSVVVGTGATGRLHRGVVLRRLPGAAREHEDVHVEFDWEPVVEGELTDATVAIMDETPAFGEAATSFGESTVSPDQRAADSRVLAERRSAFVERIDELDVDVFVCRDEVEDAVVGALETRGVVVVDRAQYPKSDVHRLARATGARVVSNSEYIGRDVLGTAGRVTELVREDEKWAVFDDCDGPVYTLIAGTETETARIERERTIEDALEVASVAAIDRQLLPGAGAAATAVSVDLRRFARSVSGTEQLAVEAFADALEVVPEELARNAGLDPVDAVAALRTAHAGDDPVPLGLDLETGNLANAYDTGIVEPRRIFSQATETARSVAEQLLTVDAVLFPNVDGERFTPRTEHE